MSFNNHFTTTPLLPRPGSIQHPPSTTGGVDMFNLVTAAFALSKFVQQVNTMATETGTQQTQQQTQISAPSVSPIIADIKGIHIKAKAGGERSGDEKPAVPKKDDNGKLTPRTGGRFPQRLMKVLKDESLNAIITWLPDGCSFIIVDHEEFEARVMSEFFAADGGSTKYQSFTRKLNRWYAQRSTSSNLYEILTTGNGWLSHYSFALLCLLFSSSNRGFRQVTTGPKAGAFYHELFRRDSPLLCNDMYCRSGRTTKVASSKLRKATRKTKSPKAARSSKPQQISNAVRPASTNLRLPEGLPTSTSVVSYSSASDCDSGSENSLSSSSASSLTAMEMVETLRKDQALLELAHRKCQEEEHLRSARAMLLAAYQKALQK